MSYYQYILLTTQEHGELPHISDQLNAGVTSETTRTLTYEKDDYDGQMIFGDLVDLKLPGVSLEVSKIPKKFSSRKLVPTGNRNRARCVTDAHATACSTALDVQNLYQYLK